MNIKDLVNRFELLNPNNSILSDLRRSYIDQDLSSIFRLVGDEHDDLRKAVVEQNLHSIFRLVGDAQNDLRKLVLEDNIWSLWKILEKQTNSQFVSAFKNFFINNIEINQDCLSQGQILSKQWLINEVKKLDLDLGVIFLCAGWYATLATMIFESGIKVDKIRSFDLDESCVQIAEIFNKTWFVDNWKFKAVTEDILNINYNEHTWQFWSNANNRMSKPITDVPTTIINTSCEHIENFRDWYTSIPNGKLLILQTNNYFEVEDHVNCSQNLKEFADITPMSTVLYQGNLELPKYTRFMRIGYK